MSKNTNSPAPTPDEGKNDGINLTPTTTPPAAPAMGAENEKGGGTAAARKPEMVKIKLDKTREHKDDEQVFINGRQYIIKRGVTVKVPAAVAEVLANQEKMMEEIYAYDEAHIID